MQIKTILSQTRRDFVAIYVCEHCGDEVEWAGYDDAHFHQTVIPGMSCRECGKKAGPDYRPLQPRYPEGALV